MAEFTENGKVVYTCDDIRSKIDEMKMQFIKKNAVRSFDDRAYMEYSSTLDNFLNACTCKREVPVISLKCSKCPEGDHEGFMRFFCRCEGRNINLAKQIRAAGISTWG